MAMARAIFDSEDDDDTDNLRYFDTPYVANYDKEFLSIIMKSPLLQIEEIIKPLTDLIDDIETKHYVIKQQLSANNVHHLTLDELGAIHLYTWEELPRTKCVYYLVNQAIRRGLSEELHVWYPYLNLLLTALNKLPSIDPHCTVYRGVRSCDLSNKYNDDGIYTWWTFSSCLPSIDRMKTGSFLGKEGVRTVFKIDCYSGKRLPWSEDDEVILMPGFRFQIVGKLRSLDDLNTIYIREIAPSSLEIMPSVQVFKKVEVPENSSPVAFQIKARRRASIKPRKAFKNAANRVIKMSKVVNGCSDHVLELSGKRLPIEELKRNLNERLTNEITILNLSKTHLTKEKMKVVAGILRTNETLVELNLSYNPLGNAGCLLMARALHDNQSLLTLNLYNTRLSTDAGQCLSEMLSSNHDLHVLHLGVNTLGSMGMKYLLAGNIQLHQLNLSCNRIDQDGCQYIANFLENNKILERLDLGGNPIGDKGIKIICNSLMNNTTLTDLRVWHCQISNSEPICDLIKSDSILKQLDLEGNRITDEQTKMILLATKMKTTLEKLNILQNKISGKAKESLQKLAPSHLSLILE